MAVVIEDKDHAEFSASGSHRWLNCPGSIELSKGYPNTESVYAAEGTKAHAVLEHLLKGHLEGNIKKAIAEVKRDFPNEMVDYALDAVHYILGRTFDLFDAEILCETEVDASPFTCADQFGTLDAALVEPHGRLIIIDYKYGAGIAVDPREESGELNSQLVYYALGISYKYKHKFREVELVVIQPRAFHPSGETTRSAVATMEELLSWVPIFKNGVKACRSPNALIKSGSWCRFCPAAIDCPGLKETALKSAQIAFSPKKELTLPDPKVFKLPDLGKVLEACDQLEVWMEKVRQHAMDLLERGHEVEGWKLVEKRGTRKWINEDEALDTALHLFGEKALTEPKLLSPAQFEKTFGKDAKKWVEQRTTTKSSGTTMVRDTDKRPAIKSPFTEIEG